jgi:hypothetical protein
VHIGLPVVGYFSYFLLHNGFSSILDMSVDEIIALYKSPVTGHLLKILFSGSKTIANGIEIGLIEETYSSTTKPPSKTILSKI